MEVETAAEWLREFGVWAVLISLIINMIIGVVGILPSLFLSGANVVVFGPVYGVFISVIGETLGAGAAYTVYRWGLRKWKGDQLSWKWVKKLQGITRKKQAIVLLSARLAPMVPSGAATFAAAAVGMRFLDFLLVTFIGKIPTVLVESMIGYDLFYIQERYVNLIVTLVMIIMIYFVLKKRKWK
ncbi:TVP38/TMEM64 family protein [Chengkuizengella axinellae]|uniref:TVP38/TMEM64 family membrane protein n=1 Tax=Chengkuizengella axinellae TaxID=3064388 RepID=A0ABT9J118_9BACL|nr:VTT domain-containing protein [Chengkuizengella sp. 2205SS18-9]MDP5275321.1 VTT domain-containing protein [Chengkuizengella sp. 2205SS18-9]